MKKLILLLAILCAPAAYGQAASYYSLDPPAPNANFRMCVMPTTGPPPNPCVTPALIFNDQGLTSAAPNPTPLGPSGTFGFWVAGGQYVIQLSGSISRTIIVTIGGGGTGTTVTVASGTAALGTSAISSGTCATVVSPTATGTLTTDNVMADFNADPTGVVGYQPSVSGMLTIIKYPTADHVNFKVCNNTAASITPGAITLNWRVVR
jgi:hypothetical protein